MGVAIIYGVGVVPNEKGVAAIYGVGGVPNENQ